VLVADRRCAVVSIRGLEYGSRAMWRAALRGLRVRSRVIPLAAAAIALVTSSTAWASSSAFQAGYRATHDAFRSVHASWVMPAITCPGQSSPGYNGEAWFGVGMGPSYSRSEQVVARAFCTGTIASYIAYFEVGGVQATGAAGGVLTPDPGDHLSATVSYLGVFPYVAGPYTYRVARYRFSLTDLTHRKSVTIVDSSDCLRQSCDHSTAEVTAGIPFARYSALANYGMVTFSRIGITDIRGRRGSFARNKRWKVARQVEFDPTTHSLAASPSALTHHGTQFSDRWHAY
jgi:hypothetical protein